MKKFYLFAAAALTALCANAENLQFYVHGEPIENGARINIGGAEYWEESLTQFNPELTLVSSQSGHISSQLTFTKGEISPAKDADWEYGADITVKFCAIDGQCFMVVPGQSLVKEGEVNANTPLDMETEIALDYGFSETRPYTDFKIDAEFTISATVGSDTVKATFYVNQAGAGVAEINAEYEGTTEYYTLQGVRVANPENGIFIVRQGDKVSKRVIK